MHSSKKFVVPAATVVITLVVGVLFAVSPTAPVGAIPCGPCSGQALTVTGHGSGANCNLALNQARLDATIQAYAPPDCTPCQISNGPMTCFYNGTDFSAAWTLNYKCRSCGF